jgi:hypothetical protein
VTPTMLHGAILSEVELALLRKITDVELQPMPA